MHSIRIQLITFITAVLLIFLVMLNIYPITSSRDLIFEEKKSALSSQAAVVASSLSGLDRLGPESVGEVLQLLDLGGFSRTVIAAAAGALTYVALYMLKTGVYGAIAGNIWAPMVSKFPASIINAGAAIVAAPVFYQAVRPALRAAGILRAEG